jgi:glycosyltransferase involved in cell wall biosynthesis
MRPVASVIVRARNEAAMLGRLLAGIRLQDCGEVETVLVDSGSTDDTRAIAADAGCRVVDIPHASFTYGRALNVGCAAAHAPVCVFVSAHCIPANDRWLSRLLLPMEDRAVAGVYGKQLPLPVTLAYEQRNLLTGFPVGSRRQTSSYFFHNANAAVRRDVWERLPFDEALTGLEDRDWARRAIAEGYTIVYEPLAMVYHHHAETLAQIYDRWLREGQALRRIEPGFRQSRRRFLLNYARAVQRDARFVRRRGLPWRTLVAALPQRFMEQWGTYRGIRARNGHGRG